jgi:DNA polymerase III epsilon subunit family exonuclease
VVDIETTGLEVRAGHEAVEVATVTVAGGAIADSWSSLVRPRRPIPADATRVHGITDAMVAAAPEPRDVAAALRRRCGDRVLAFHQAPFDLPFLAGLLRAGDQPPLLNPVLDTLGLARGFPDPAGQALGAITARLGLEHGTHHRALPDALATARLLLALVPRWEGERGVATLMELCALSQDVLRAARPAPRAPSPPAPAPLPLFEGWTEDPRFDP